MDEAENRTQKYTVLLFVSSFCRGREAELSRNTVCSLGLRLFFPLNLPLPHLSPLVQHDGDCLRYRRAWSRDTLLVPSGWFSISGDSLSNTVERGLQR